MFTGLSYLFCCQMPVQILCLVGNGYFIYKKGLFHFKGKFPFVVQIFFLSVVEVFFYDPEMQKYFSYMYSLALNYVFFFKVEITTICIHVLYIYFQSYIITTYFGFFLYSRISRRFFTIWATRETHLPEQKFVTDFPEFLSSIFLRQFLTMWFGR